VEEEKEDLFLADIFRNSLVELKHFPKAEIRDEVSVKLVLDLLA